MKMRQAVRVFTGLALVFFVVITILTALIVIPQFNNNLEQSHSNDLRTTLNLEAELFQKEVQTYQNILKDLSSFPVVTNTMLLGTPDDPSFIDLVGNFSINGQKSQLVFIDIVGQIMYQSDGNFHGNFAPKSRWINQLLEGESELYFQLLDLKNRQLRFVVSIPIFYLGNIEGILSAEINAPISDFFSTKILEDGGAFRVKQNDVLVATSTANISIPQEASIEIEELGVSLTHIGDAEQSLIAQNYFRNTVYFVLLIGLSVSFVFFMLFGYRTLVVDEDEAKISKELTYRAYALPVFTGAIGIVSSAVAALLLYNIQLQASNQNQISSSKASTSIIQRGLEFNVQAIKALKAFYDGSDKVSRQEFSVFASSIVEGSESIQALGWVSFVSHAERKNYVANLKAEGLSNFKITNISEDGKFKEAPKSDFYAPIRYIEPMIGNEDALGFDLNSEEIRSAALIKAANTGRLVATPPIKLIRNGSQNTGILLICPIYEKGHSVFDGHNVHDQGALHIEGYVVSVVWIDDIITPALHHGGSGTDIIVEDVTEPENIKPFYGTVELGVDSPNSANESSINFADRIWRIKYISNKPSRAFSIEIMLPLSIFLVGVLFSVFTAFSFMQLVRRRQVIEGVVALRTTQIQDAKKFQDLIMSNIPDLLFVKDEEFRIVNANPAFLNVYPSEMRDQVLGTTTVEAYDEEEANAFFEQDRKAFLKGRSETEETIRFPDGKNRTLLTTKVRFENEQGAPFILGIGRDITALKQAEEELLRSNIELERFAYVASHDLQEPLRMVTNFTSLLEQQYAEKLDDTAKQYIDFAYSGARRMQDLVNDLLEYARIGQKSERLEETDLNEILGIIEQNLEEIIQTSGAKLHYEGLPTVRTNPVRMMSLLQNLVGNAIKYREALEPPVINLDVVSRSNEFVISVKDNGIGMRPEYCEKIFEPFKRLHGKNEYHGTGMGLAICRKIVEGFNGKIWAEASLGEGSVFHFTLPRNLVVPENEKEKAT